MAFSFQAGMKGRPTDALEECPYDKCHKISCKKFSAHLLACRRSFKLKQLRLGGPIDVFVCQYNSSHLVYAPELIFHESRCEDRHVIRSHQVNIIPLKEAGLYFEDVDLVAFQQDEKEFAELFQGIDIGVIHGCDKFGKKFQIEDIKYPKKAAQRKAEEKGMSLAKEVEMESREEERRKYEPEMTPEDKAEFEYWNRTPDGPGFDFMKVVNKKLVQ